MFGLLNVSKVLPQGQGFLCELKSANQMSENFKEDIARCAAPQMICGFCACANAGYIAEHFPKLEMTRTEINRMMNHLRNFKIMQPRITALMELWNKWRYKWIKEHQQDFTTSEEKRYLEDWVANYEISDWIQHEQSNEQLAFVRKIETDFKSLKHEEKQRVDEEIPFRDKYTLFMDDPFLNPSSDTKLWTPEEWITERGQNQTAKSFVVDVGGHFVTAKPVRIIEEDSNTTTPVLLVINSYTPNCLPNIITSGLFSLFFNQDPIACLLNK